MRRFQAKKKWYYLMSSWPALFVLVLILGIFAFGVFGFVGKLRHTAQNKNNAEERVLELRERKASLESNMEFLATEEGRERVLRQDFGMAKVGEGVIVLVDEETEAPEPEKKGFFKFFKKMLK